MTTKTILSSKEVSVLTAEITGGGFKRSADKEAAIQRLYSAASDRNIPVVTIAEVLEADNFEQARAYLAAAITELKPVTEAKPAKAEKPAATTDEPKLVTHDLGADWFLNMNADGTYTFRNSEKGQRIDLPVESVQLLKAIFATAGGTRKPRAPKDGGPNKREIAADLLLRTEGTTSAEILEATGWPAVSVPAIAKASGLTLRQEKDGRTTRYWGTKA